MVKTKKYVKPMTIARWTELANDCLVDGPPKQEMFETWLFINRCEVRQRGSKPPYLLRQTGVVNFRASTQKGLDQQVMFFVASKNVRLLVEGLESNDFDVLPKKVQPVPQDVLDGTASIYQPKEETDE
jgi:hypothetical protein